MHQTYRVPVPLPEIPLSVSTIFPAKVILEKQVVLFSVILPGILREFLLILLNYHPAI